MTSRTVGCNRKKPSRCWGGSRRRRDATDPLAGATSSSPNFERRGGARDEHASELTHEIPTQYKVARLGSNARGGAETTTATAGGDSSKEKASDQPPCSVEMNASLSPSSSSVLGCTYARRELVTPLLLLGGTDQ